MEKLFNQAFKDKEPITKVLIITYGSNSEEKTSKINQVINALKLSERNILFAIAQRITDECLDNFFSVDQGLSKNLLDQKCFEMANFISNRVLEKGFKKGFHLVWDITGICIPWVIRTLNYARTKGYLILLVAPNVNVESDYFAEIEEKNTFFEPIVDKFIDYTIISKKQAIEAQKFEDKYFSYCGNKTFSEALETMDEPFVIQSYVYLKEAKQKFSETHSNALSMLSKFTYYNSK